MAFDSTPLGHGAAAGQQSDDEQHDGDDQQYVDERADRVRPDDSQQLFQVLFVSRPPRG
jgi:hypothetical protein